MVHVAEPGCDLGRLAQLVSLEDGGRGHVTFSCDGEATRGSLYCNGSHWSGDTDTCGGEILTRGLLGQPTVLKNVYIYIYNLHLT